MDDHDAKLDAVILAGGINRIELYDGYQPSYKALLDINGLPSIHYSIETLLKLDQIGRILIVGPEEKIAPILSSTAAMDRIAFESGGSTLVNSIVSGLRYFHDSNQVLFITADIPLITTKCIQSFIDESKQGSSKYEENLHISVVPEAHFKGRFKEAAKGFNRFRDIAICHGNIMLVNPSIMENEKAREKIDALYDARKNPLKAALAIGIRLGSAYCVGVHLLHALKMKHMAKLASMRFGFGIIPVIINHPEVAIDIDEPEDYRFVINQIQNQPLDATEVHNRD